MQDIDVGKLTPPEQGLLVECADAVFDPPGLGRRRSDGNQYWMRTDDLNSARTLEAMGLLVLQDNEIQLTELGRRAASVATLHQVANSGTPATAQYHADSPSLVHMQYPTEAPRLATLRGEVDFRGSTKTSWWAALVRPTWKRL